MEHLHARSPRLPQGGKDLSRGVDGARNDIKDAGESVRSGSPSTVDDKTIRVEHWASLSSSETHGSGDLSLTSLPTGSAFSLERSLVATAHFKSAKSAPRAQALNILKGLQPGSLPTALYSRYLGTKRSQGSLRLR